MVYILNNRREEPIRMIYDLFDVQRQSSTKTETLSQGLKDNDR